MVTGMRRYSLFSVLLACAAPVSAVPLDYDCDVPADSYSSVSALGDTGFSIGGTVVAVQKRSGKNLPVAGARITSVDGKASAGLQLVSTSEKNNKFDVVVTLNVGGGVRRGVAGQIDLDQPSSFFVQVSKDGRFVLRVGNIDTGMNFVPIGSGKMMVFCSTGQFKFTNLVFGAGDEPIAFVPPIQVRP